MNYRHLEEFQVTFIYIYMYIYNYSYNLLRILH